MPTVELLKQYTTREGYSTLVLAEGTGVLRRAWWACCGCWSRSDSVETMEPIQDDLFIDPYVETFEELLTDAESHVVWCSVLPPVQPAPKPKPKPRAKPKARK